MDEMELCDQQIGCAGVTFTLPPSSSDEAETSPAAELLQVMVHNYLPPNLGDLDASVSNKDQVQMRIASWERRRQVASATADNDIHVYDDDDIQSEGSNKKEEKR